MITGHWSGLLVRVGFMGRVRVRLWVRVSVKG